ncbi:MAG: polyprenyl synthetase family protein [Theionarchaea archaeon]|nr:polyprenyl synthetase family protein [Theionarchaea archaeon]
MATQPSLVEILDPISDRMEGVDQLLHAVLKSTQEPLSSVLLRTIRGGKRLRPAMVILVGEMFGREGEPFLRLAASIEMLHTATLIHDDLLDKSPLRRGRETYHTIWPVNATVLAGDFLLAKAVSMVASLDNPRILRIISDTFCSMWWGEIKQTFGIDWRNGGMEEYIRVIDAKTASLFSAAAQMSSILSEADEDHVESLKTYGRELGFAFQISDDIMDFVGDREKTGKPVASDLRQGVVTLPTLYYLRRGGDESLIGSIMSREPNEENLDIAVAAICSSGAIEDSQAEALRHVEKCKSSLSNLSEGPSRNALASIAEIIVRPAMREVSP